MVYDLLRTLKDQYKQSKYVNTLRFVGLGFYWAWVGLAFFSNSLIYSSPNLFTVDMLWTCCTAVHMAVLILFSVFPSPSESLFRHPISPAFFSIFMAFGTFLIVVSSLFSSPLALIIGGFGILLAGSSGAAVVLMWGMAYCQLSFRELLLCAFLAYILMGMIHIISSRMSPLAVIVIVCALPLLSGATLRRSDAQRQAGESIAPTSQESYGTWRLIVPLLALFFFAFCGELLRSFSLASNAADVGSMGTLYHLGGAVGSAVLLLAIFLPPLSRRLRAFESALVIIRWVFIVMAAAFVFVSFFNIPFEVSYALFSAGFHCLRAVAWVFVIQLVQRFGFSPVRSVGLSQCVIAAAPVVSLLLFPILFSVNLTALPWDSISLIFLFIMFVLVSFLLGSKAIQTVSTPLTQEAQTIDAPASPDSHAPHTQGSGLPVAEGSDGVSMAEKLRERGLSAREVDVACLLARGRSLPFIKDELSISLATAQTHQRHIYQKLKVHSRQEFLDTTEAL